MFERGSFEVLSVVLIILFSLIFYLDKYLPQRIRDIQYTCFKKCESDACQNRIRQLRNTGYWLDGADKIGPHEKCAFTFYELTHVLLHIWIGYDYGLFTSAAISLPFELLEHYLYDAGSIADLGWNLLGAIIGNALSGRPM